MFVIIGIVTVFVCVLGGYVAMGEKLAALWQPFEVVIIVGAAIGVLRPWALSASLRKCSAS